MGVVKRGGLKGLNWLHMLSEASKAGFTIPPCTPPPNFFLFFPATRCPLTADMVTQKTPGDL